jgi:REP element-mobilizing transposase RayT
MVEPMPRPPRIQFACANHLIVTRVGRLRALFHDLGDYERFTEELRQEVERSRCVVLAFFWMLNHLHTLLQTPEPSLAAEMQHSVCTST